MPTRVRSGAVSQPEKPPSRFARILEVEDLLLALWLLAAETLVVRYSGRKPVEWAEPGQNSCPGRCCC